MPQTPSPRRPSPSSPRGDHASSNPNDRLADGEQAESHARHDRPEHAIPAPARTGSSSFHDLLESRAAVLGILFFVTGALGLPLLWLSSRFTWPARIFWAVVVTVYTVLLIALVVMVLQWSYNRIF